MSNIGIQNNARLAGTGDVLTNNFAIVAATVNGSGSQTANTVLIRAMFKMGIPVNGKNVFPSNISGLPTWYTIRVSKDGYIARREDYHVLVAITRRPRPRIFEIWRRAAFASIPTSGNSRICAPT